MWERLANLRFVGVEPRIWEYDDVHCYFFKHGCVGCQDFTEDGDMCWCVLGRPIADTRWPATEAKFYDALGIYYARR